MTQQNDTNNVYFVAASACSTLWCRPTVFSQLFSFWRMACRTDDTDSVGNILWARATTENILQPAYM